MSSPSFFNSLSETARGFFGRFSSNLHARSSNALLHSSTTSLPLAPPAPSMLSRFSKSSVSLSTDGTVSSSADIGQQVVVKTPSSVADEAAEKTLGSPGKKRFEGCGFSFHFKHRNGSTSSLVNSASADLKTSPNRQPQHQQLPQQQSQCHERQQLSDVRQQRQCLQPPNQFSKDKDSRRAIRHSSMLSRGVVHASSSDKASAKQRPTFRRHHTDTPSSSIKKAAPTLISIAELNANDNAGRTAVPRTVNIRHLPEYIPDASFGHNAKRNERYARIRLAALREHQLVLVNLLSDLLETENRFRQQHQHLEQVVASGHTGGQARPTCQHYKREAAAHEYQKALLDLWQADNSLCHWLIRYIRTARRVSRNLDLMLLDSSAACASGSPVSLKNNASTIMNNHNVLRLTGGVLAANTQCSTFDLVSTTLPHVDEVSRWAGQNATLRQANKTLKPLDPVRAPATHPGVSRLAAPPSPSLLRIPFQAPKIPPPPVPAPQPPRGSAKSTPGSRPTQQPRTHVHTMSRHKPRLQNSLGFQPCKASIVGGDLTEEKRFQDYDELEVAVFVGRHMQSLQKANEFLYRFDREAGHSTIALDRFEKTREIYRRRVNRG